MPSNGSTYRFKQATAELQSGSEMEAVMKYAYLRKGSEAGCPVHPTVIEKQA